MFVLSFFFRLIFRILQLIFISAICSLTIYLGSGYLGLIGIRSILFAAFVLFSVVIAIDTYRFSFAFWRLTDFFLYQLVPMASFIGLSFVTYFTMRPFIFNRIFLPFRWLVFSGISTFNSMIVVSCVLIAGISVLRYYGARAGYFFDLMQEIEASD